MLAFTCLVRRAYNKQSLIFSSTVVPVRTTCRKVKESIFPTQHVYELRMICRIKGQGVLLQPHCLLCISKYLRTAPEDEIKQHCSVGLRCHCCTTFSMLHTVYTQITSFLYLVLQCIADCFIYIPYFLRYMLHRQKHFTP